MAQQVGASGADLVRGIATGYEVQVNLVKAIRLHKHKIDHVAHLSPSAAAGIGTLLPALERELPNQEQLAIIDPLPLNAHPMDICRTATSVLGARHDKAEES